MTADVEQNSVGGHVHGRFEGGKHIGECMYPTSPTWGTLLSRSCQYGHSLCPAFFHQDGLPASYHVPNLSFHSCAKLVVSGASLNINTYTLLAECRRLWPCSGRGEHLKALQKRIRVTPGHPKQFITACPGCYTETGMRMEPILVFCFIFGWI